MKNLFYPLSLLIGVLLVSFLQYSFQPYFFYIEQSQLFFMGLRLLPWTFVFARRIQRLVVRISNTILFLSVCRCIVYRIMGDSHGIVGWKLVEKDFRDIFDGYDGLDSGTLVTACCY